MLVKQCDLGCCAHASCVIAAAVTGATVVVDPPWDIAPYLHHTIPHSWPINPALPSHFQADVLPGHCALWDHVSATTTGARICLLWWTLTSPCRGNAI